ncbi:hypothetical protein J6590_055522 [Homalodisca vitripennis]|nr:hypothetical protein J6590_055522 [Homalodisca vitripennis]
MIAIVTQPGKKSFRIKDSPLNRQDSAPFRGLVGGSVNGSGPVRVYGSFIAVLTTVRLVWGYQSLCVPVVEMMQTVPLELLRRRFILGFSKRVRTPDSRSQVTDSDFSRCTKQKD